MGWIAWIAINSTFFGFIGGKEDEHRGRFDATGLREDCNDYSMIFSICAREAKKEVYWRAEDTFWRRSDFSVFLTL